MSDGKCGAISIGAAATLACLYEATAPKPGNVHPGASFEDATSYADFVASAVVVGPILERTAAVGVGATVLEAVRATREEVTTNTNVGTLLLIAPLAAVPREQTLGEGVAAVLDRLTDDDTRRVYEAIRLSGAGGLKRVTEADVHAEAPPGLSLVAAMRMAAERDLVARQYTNQFADILQGPAEWIVEGLSRGWPLREAIVHAHLRQLARHPDSLIGRKCGVRMAAEAQLRAADALRSGFPGDHAYATALGELDAWLRADGHRRNPGTTADLIAAGLFVLLREGQLNWRCW